MSTNRYVVVWSYRDQVTGVTSYEGTEAVGSCTGPVAELLIEGANLRAKFRRKRFEPKDGRYGLTISADHR